MMRALASLLAIFLALVATPAAANWCGTPGRDGSPTISGVVNTYYPGTASVAAGATSIPVGASTGAATPIAAGDLLLVIQMQDATIDTRNGTRYGDGANGAPGGGYSAIGQSGKYEFVRATSAVSGGSVSIAGATGGGLANSYNYAALSDTSARKSYQVIRVPQYDQIILSGTVSALAWNGSTGGVVVFDVARRLTFSGGTVTASGLGFRGGGGRALAGGTGTNGDYVTAATNAANASKGEGVAGTPRYVAGTSLVDNLLEGYPGGSYARGAPANAGGGGTDGNPAANDQNTGGGGGGNGGPGGVGGYAWCSTAPTGCPQTGGEAGVAVAELSVSRVTMGGGGGAGSTNNATGSPGSGFASSGAAGGGIVMIRAGELAGIGTVSADGASANSTVLNDATGGGGAGGAVLVSALSTVAGTSISANARGGDGGNNTGGGAARGPGGGGGGGYVASSVTVSTSVTGGSAGTTQNGGSFGSNYGATGGSGGNGIAITGASIPGMSSGGECTPTVTKAFATAPVAVGATSRMSITVTNNNPTTSLTSLVFTDNYPSGLANTASPSATKSCATAGTLNAAANGTSFAVSAATISAASSCTYSVNTDPTTTGDKTNSLAAGAVTGNYGSYPVSSLAPASAVLTVTAPLTIAKSSQTYSDPANGTTNPKAIPGGFVTYSVTVANPGSGTVDNNSIVIADPTPANLSLFVGNLVGSSGPVVFTDGSPSSGLTYTYTSLASTTDDVEFSKDGGATWTYVPVPNASGVDALVTHIRFKPKGTMAAHSSFSLQFRYVVK
jgi:hypothetical protein